VADWARKVLKFSETSAQVLIDQEIDGSGLLAIQSTRNLRFYGLLGGPANKLWAEIEKMKKVQADSGT